MELRTNRRDQVAVGLLALCVIGAVLFFAFFQKNTVSEVPTKTEFSEALSKSLSGEDQTQLQNFAVEQIKAEKKDDQTLSAIYWITHRYFDNGGNIYEIYDFVNANPEISFLKKAEEIYPTIFETIKTTRVKNNGYESLMALLAYYEVIDQNEYAGIAIWGLAANKYSEQTLKNIENPYDSPELKAERSKYFIVTSDKAKYFTNRIRQFIIANTMERGSLDELLKTSLSKEDLLVGLNQYASALLNLKGAGVPTISDFTPTEIFEFNSQLARTEAPRLYFFTNYLYATALVNGNEATPGNVTLPLSRVVEYAELNKEWRQGGSVERVIRSKDSNDSSLFAYATTKKLAALNIDFKNWLMKNGWEESDF